MKLYSVELSPFASRVRMAIYAKALKVEIVPPPAGGLKSPEYLAIHPMGKIPALQTDDGQVIVESETILEYLEDKFPTPSLRGATPEETARMRLIARVTELYVAPHLQALFGQMNPQTRDQAKTDEALAKLDAGLGHLSRFMADGPYAAGGRLSMADCSIAPMLFFLPMLGGAFGRDVTAAYPKVTAYVRALQADPVFQRVSVEMQRGLAAMRAGQR